MLFWVCGYLFTLFVLHAHCASLFRLLRSGDEPGFSFLAGVIFTFCLHLSALSTLVIRELSDSTMIQILMVALGGVPISLVVWLARVVRFKDERVGSNRGMYS